MTKGITRRVLLASALSLTGLGAYATFGRNPHEEGPATTSTQPLVLPPKEQMTYRTNKHGEKVSLLGFGCMRYPVMAGESSPRSAKIDKDKAFALVDCALEHGVNYFDTAWGYHQGASEEVTGLALQRHPRESFNIATKMPSYLSPTLSQAKEIFSTQLKKCRVEYFDYYLLHTLSTVEAYQKTYEQEKVLDFLLAERKAGRIRNLGWSFHGTSDMLTYVLNTGVEWDFAMIQLNYHDLLYKFIQPKRRVLAEPAPAKWMYETMVASGLPLIIMEPLLGGRLARLNKQALQILQQENPTASAASWAFRYVGGLPNIMTVLSGMTYMEHLKDNLVTYAPHVPMSRHEHTVLKAALDAFVVAENIPCTTCGYCMPCPYGVDIPKVFRHHNDCLDDNLVPKHAGGREDANVRKAYLVRMRKRMPMLRTALHCTGCKECVRKCPQFIDIPEEMAKLGRLLQEQHWQV